MSKFLHANLRGIALSSVLAGLSLELTNVFLALLLLNRGLKLWHVCGFYLLYAIVALITNHPCCWLINRYGARIGFLLGYGVRAIQAAILTALVAGTPNWAAIPLAITFALAGSLLLNTRSLHVARVMAAERKGRDIARLENLARAVSWIAPLGGGLIAAAQGQIWLGAIAASLAVLAVVPVWGSDRLQATHVATEQTDTQHPVPWRDLLASIGWNWQSGVGFWAWSIYLAATIPSFRAIGAIATISSAVTTGLMELVGQGVDARKWGTRLFPALVLLCSLVHLGRIGAALVVDRHSTATAVPFVVVLLTAATAIYSLGTNLLAIPWQAHYYAEVRRHGPGYLASMQAAGSLGHVILWSGLSLAAYFAHSGSTFMVAFATASLLVWCCLLISRPAQN